MGHFKLSKEHSPKFLEKIDYMSKVPYTSVVGSLMYDMVSMRPDIAHSVGVVSRFLSKLRKMQWKAVKWILRYLRETSKAALIFGGSGLNLQGYVDSNLSGNFDK